MRQKLIVLRAKEFRTISDGEIFFLKTLDKMKDTTIKGKLLRVHEANRK